MDYVVDETGLGPVLTARCSSWTMARQFAIEYASLFDGLLPTFEHLELPIPLGGTSNHFPVAILRALGGWDPYNVTEDADLGVRLARLGYRTSVLSSVTYEEAPFTMRDWFTQRTRWLKGWMRPFESKVYCYISDG